MEFYDGDLKDIWDSDLDPTDSLKISTETDMHDWFLERDVKDPTVILNDKLISDALLNGTLPIKSEHSYSINSDGDSLPASPRSLHTKMDDMEDECYPAISLKTATSNLRSIDTITIDPKCLLISSSASSSCSSSSSSSSSSLTNSTHSSSVSLGVGHCSPVIVTSLAGGNSSASSPLLSSQSTHSHHSHSQQTASVAYTGQLGASKGSGPTTTFTLRSLEHGSCIATSPATLTLSKRSAGAMASVMQPHAKHAHLSGAAAAATQHHHQLSHHLLHSNSNSASATTASALSNQQHLQPASLNQHTLLHQQQHSLPHHQFGGAIMDGSVGCSSPASSSMREGSTSPDICSDIEIDESCIKDEPMSPDSSCPPSPHAGRAATATHGSLNLSVANMAAFTHSDLVFEHKNGCLQLTPASQSLLKSQQLLLSSGGGPSSATLSSAASNIVIPKFNIKTEAGGITKTAIVTHNTSAAAAAASATATVNGNGKTYGVPLTPPSSLSSDDSEGNLSPEPLYSPLSPATAASLAGVEGLASSSASTSSSTSSSSLSANAPANATGSGRRNVAGNCHGLGRGNAGGNAAHGSGSSAGGASGGSTRQPIHTPLISTQPKGSTGTLILTEEEKRTLLAEGYPIPQKLPLTKAEEKSLKKIRRKIKNKISAQESRRKKKEYMDQLERKVEILVSENSEYKKRIDSLEDANASLLSQLHKLQALVAKAKKHSA